jgi:carbon-monoxide dehydrogenase large subunit
MVGQRIARREDAKYLKGRGAYVDDLELPRMLHAAFVRSPHAHAEIGRIDTERALAVTGVHAVVTGADLRAACSGPLEIEVTLERPEVRTSRQPVLPVDKVRFIGEAAALVVADSRYIAEDAAELVDVDWRPLPPVLAAADALREGAPAIQDGIPDNNFAHIEYASGDVAAAFERAAHVFRKRFDAGRWSANPLETRGAVASYEPASGDYEVWSSCQSPHALRAFLAIIMGIREGQLRCHAPDVGGSFGVKGQIYPEEAALLIASQIVGRPVKWIEDRAEHLACTSHAKQMTVELEVAVAEDGRLIAFSGHYEGDAGAYAQFPPTPLIDVLQAAALLPNIYDLEAVRYSLDCAFTNKCPAGAARGVGWTSGQMVREALLDEIARTLEIDPGELRTRNCLPPNPTISKTGLAYDGGSYSESIERVLELCGYRALREQQQLLRATGRHPGIGISPFIEPCAYGTIHARALGLGGATYDTASLTVESDGSVIVRTGFHSHGQGHQTTFAQVAADALDVPMDCVHIIQAGDTDSATFGMGTFGSRGAVIGAELIARTAADVRIRLVACAAHLLGCASDEIELSEGVFSVRDDAARSMTLPELAGAFYYGGPETKPVGLEPLLSATRAYDPPESYANGAAVAAVEVDADTGLVEVKHMWFVEDCGVMLNPMIVEGQIAGGAAQGIGIALLEELVYDEGGQLSTGTLMDYLYTSATDVPDMTFDHLETRAPTASGVKGAGEGGAIAAAAAVIQAVADALSPYGARVTATPLTPDRVLALIDSVPRVT